MGKGKGDPEFWVDVIRPGRIIYELEGVTEDVAQRGDAPGVAQASDEDPVHLPGE